MKFNKSQASAISHRDGAMLVLAGPGSGKTAVITQRTKTLITEYDVNPSNILLQKNTNTQIFQQILF